MMRACKGLVTATLVLVLFELAHSGLCPPCYRDQAVLQGHGAVSSTDSRRRLIIANDVPGDHNSKVTSGIEGAAGKWNNARDTTSKSSRRIDRFGNEFRYRAKVTDKHKDQLGRWLGTSSFRRTLDTGLIC